MLGRDFRFGETDTAVNWLTAGCDMSKQQDGDLVGPRVHKSGAAVSEDQRTTADHRGPQRNLDSTTEGRQ